MTYLQKLLKNIVEQNLLIELKKMKKLKNIEESEKNRLKLRKNHKIKLRKKDVVKMNEDIIDRLLILSLY